jgi:cysteine desulfuration protein SufE
LNRLFNGFNKSRKRRYEYLIYFARSLAPLDDDLKVPENKVPGCASQVYVTASLEEGKVIFQGDSGSQLTKGLVGMLIAGLNGLTPAEIIQITPDFIQRTGLDISLTASRANGFYNIFQTIQQKVLVSHLAETKSQKKGNTTLSELKN